MCFLYALILWLFYIDSMCAFRRALKREAVYVLRDASHMCSAECIVILIESFMSMFPVFPSCSKSLSLYPVVCRI